MTINFYLSHPKAKNLSSIFLLINHKGKQYRYFTSKKVGPQKWKTGQYHADPAFRAQLEEIKGHGAEVFNRLQKQNRLTQKNFKIEMQQIFEPETNLDSFCNFIRYFIEHRKVKRSSKTIFESFHNKIKRYEKEDRQTYLLADINSRWASHIIGKMQAEGMGTNTIFNTMNFIKMVYKEAYNMGLCKDRSILYVKVPSENTKHIYLNKEEIERLYRTELKENEKEAVDAFVIMCYTALRFSDYASLTKDNFKQNFIHVPIKKTGRYTIIPCHPRIHEIINRYGRLPYKGIAAMNNLIKRAAKKAGINDKVIIGRLVNGEVKREVKEKWQLVKVHTARRSAATNMFLEGIKKVNIMKITGHRSEESFMRYICIDEQENANMLQHHSFFSA